MHTRACFDSFFLKCARNGNYFVMKQRVVRDKGFLLEELNLFNFTFFPLTALTVQCTDCDQTFLFMAHSFKSDLCLIPGLRC